jgi:hypothetical protein
MVCIATPIAVERQIGTAASRVHPIRSALTRGSRPCTGLTVGHTREGANERKEEALDELNNWADKAVAELLAACFGEVAFELERWALQLGRER